MYDQGTHGHRSLSATLKQRGFDVYNVFFGDKIIQDLPTVSNRELDAIEHLMKNIKPDLVGLSITSLLCHPAALAVMERVKRAVDVPVIWGGPYPSLLPDYCVRNAPVDYVCVSEGEDSVSELCARLAAGASGDDVAGIFSRNTMRLVRRDPPNNVDLLPLPDIDVDSRKYLISSADGSITEGDPFHRTGGYNTKCSRNCPFNCSFCSAPNVRQLSSAGVSLRRHSVPRIIEELLHARELNPKVSVVGFWDDTFPAEKNWVEEFATSYREKINLPFHIWAHPKTVRESNIAALASAGLKGTLLGIESACEETRKKVFLRPESNAEIVKVDEILERHGVDRGYDIIVDHPWESPTELQDTFDLMARLKNPFRVNMHSLILFPETSLAKRAIREGLAKDEQELIDCILVNVDEARNKFQWVRRVPLQRDLRRAYWVFLILCLGNRKIPTKIITSLARIPFLRKHPELLTDVQVIDMRKENDEFGDYVMTLYRRSRVLGRVLRAVPALDRALDAAFRRSTSFSLYSYLLHRLVTRLPRVVLRSLRGQPAGAVAP
jgi:anaerobic magnesium-protoporphyrin IX monomethyl ester cyclase